MACRHCLAVLVAALLAGADAASAQQDLLLGLCPANAARADSYTQVLCEGESELQAGDHRAALERFRFAAALPRLDASHELAWAGLAAAHCRAREFEAGRQWADRYAQAHRLWRGELDCQPASSSPGPRLSDYVRSRMCIEPLVADYAAVQKNPQAAAAVELQARLQQVADGLAQLCSTATTASAGAARPEPAAAAGKTTQKKRPKQPSTQKSGKPPAPPRPPA